jgi:uncharacterized protein YndB with AHSA1/START domain
MIDQDAELRDRIEIEITYPHPIERVWQALTNADVMARWFMPSDFVPRLGQRFTFQTKPDNQWNGIVHCEIVALDPPTRLAYTWGNEQLDPPTLVTFTLAEDGGGTRLRLVHSGFAAAGPRGLTVRDILASGWDSHVLRESLAAELDTLAAEGR